MQTLNFILHFSILFVRLSKGTGDFISSHHELLSPKRLMEFKADSKIDDTYYNNINIYDSSKEEGFYLHDSSFDGLMSSPKSLGNSYRDSFKREIDRQEIAAFLHEGRETEIEVGEYNVDETTSCFGGSDE